MKARTIGPILMMALGATLMVAPASGWVGAQSQTPCDTSVVNGAAEVVDPCTCPTEIAVGVQVVCDTIVVDTVVETTPDTAAPGTTAVGSGGGNAGGGLPNTGSSSTPWLILIGGTLVLAGGALLVTGRNRRPADQA